MTQDSGLGTRDSGLGAQGSGLRTQDSGLRTQDSGLRTQDSKFRAQGDLPPTNRASRSLVKFVFGEEDEHEEALYGTANHRVSEGSRGRYAGQGTVQEAWVQ
ncbi:alkyl hydroperoxide reductase [Burkholderia pseudomallei]|nr:alkyl hydroperoxide reductase [Burkholderia pseudomallei]